MNTGKPLAGEFAEVKASDVENNVVAARALPSSDSPQERPIRSYVLRQGRLSDAQQRYIQQQMPIIGIPYQRQPFDFERLFGNTVKPVLEIGFGMGETTAHIAGVRPQDNFLAIEVHSPGVGNLCKLIVENNITNLRLCQHDAVEVVRDMLAEQSLSGIHVFFPDPWHKKRHNKRRLLQAGFVAELTKRLSPGGYLHCATDWQEYAEQMLEVLQSEPLLINTATSYAIRPVYRPVTKFEKRGVRLGHGVWDLIFKRRAATDPTTP